MTPLGKKNLNEEASDVKPTLLYRFEEENMLNQTPIKSVRMQTDAKIQIGQQSITMSKIEQRSDPI